MLSSLLKTTACCTNGPSRRSPFRLLSTYYVCKDQPKCTLERTITSTPEEPEPRILYTLGVSEKIIKDLGNIQFLDVVPLGTRLEGGVLPSTFAYIEGGSGSDISRIQLLTPFPVWGEVIEVNEQATTTSISHPCGFLVQVDGGMVEDEDDDYAEWVKEQQPVVVSE